MDNLPNLVYRLSQNPFNYLCNFEVAKKYWELGHNPAAVSFFLRCAEYGVDNPEANDYVYSSLLAIAKCYDNQKNREYSVSNTLLQAIAFDDSRPEAYFLLSNYYERAAQWQECYTFAKLGDSWVWWIENKPLPIDVGFFSYGCEFELAVSAYWLGRKDESIERFKKLAAMDLIPEYARAVQNNLEKLNVGI